MLWPDDIYLPALGLDRTAVTALRWSGPGSACSHCGRPIDPGDPYSPVAVGTLFSDTRALASPGTGIVCGGCLIARTKRFMNRASFVLFTRAAAYPVAKDVHKAWLFLDPPEPPFIAVHSSATMQHLVWRAAVTRSRDLIAVRHGQEQLWIRPAVLRECIAAAAAIRARRGDKAPASPFLRLERAAAFDPAHGTLSPRALEHMTADDIYLFERLTAGEVWALAFLLTAKPPVPTQPEPIPFREVLAA